MQFQYRALKSNRKCLRFTYNIISDYYIFLLACWYFLLCFLCKSSFAALKKEKLLTYICCHANMIIEKGATDDGSPDMVVFITVHIAGVGGYLFVLEACCPCI